MIQIIGKGGMAREIASCIEWQFKRDEFDELDFKTDVATIIAIGDGIVRKRIAEQYPNLDYITLNRGRILAPYSVDIGVGTIVCPEAIITCDVMIGKHCIININANIHHDCILGDYVTISPSATICGNVYIGDLCFIGANAVIKEKVKICDEVTIGAGAVVVKDITEPGVYVGNPARKIK